MVGGNGDKAGDHGGHDGGHAGWTWLFDMIGGHGRLVYAMYMIQ